MSIWLSWAQVLEESAVGTGIAESILLFPVIEAVHLLGLAFSVGLLLIVDLRLLGWILPKVPSQDVLQQLRPWILSGFGVTFFSGALLFASGATRFIVNPAFLIKFVFIALAGLNAWYFEHRLATGSKDWGNSIRLPSAVRRAGLASLGLWALVLLTGRLIPYLA
jgi:hypothetical protein